MIERIKSIINLIPFSVDNHQIELLSTYADILKLSNRKSFASWDSDEKGIDMHFKDSFYTLPDIKVSSFIDIGSGAGIPGIIYAILWPDAKAMLLDSQTKRCEFLKEALKTLHLEQRVKIICARAESLAKNPSFREKYELATARALAVFPDFFKYVSGFVNKGGYIHVIRGAKDSQYFINPNQFRPFGLRLLNYKTYQLNEASSLRYTGLLVKT